MTKLTEAQAVALRVLNTAEGWRNALKLKKAAPARLDIRTLYSLERLGLIKSRDTKAWVNEYSSIAWRIKRDGIRAINNHDFKLNLAAAN